VAIRLYLDEHVDIALADLLNAASGFHVVTTQQAGRAGQGLSDEDQLRYATGIECAIFSYNVKDFVPLARQWAASGEHHAGILWSEQAPAYRLAARLQDWARSHPDGLLPDMVMRLP
jgi:hypothetical protein